MERIRRILIVMALMTALVFVAASYLDEGIVTAMYVTGVMGVVLTIGFTIMYFCEVEMDADRNKSLRVKLTDRKIEEIREQIRAESRGESHTIQQSS